MIKIELINLKIEIEEEVMELKLWLTQKEDLEYSNWKASPLNEKDKSAKDKILAQLKQDDEDWIRKESELSEKELALKMVNIRVDTLQNTLRAISNDKSGINYTMFEKLQADYLKDLGI